MSPKVVVIGGGVAGLTLAFELMERAEVRAPGLEVVCLEASPRPGGLLGSERDDQFLCESGPSGFLDSAPCTITLARRLGLAERLIHSRPGAAVRYLFRKGKLRKIPAEPRGLITSDVLSWPGKLRLWAEPLARRGRGNDESVHEFARRRLGRQAADVLADALCGGIWAGDARQLSLAATFPEIKKLELEYGSLGRGWLTKRRARVAAEGGDSAAPETCRLASFREGMQELTDALARALGSRLQCGEQVIAVSDLGIRGVRIHRASGAPIDASAVILATPAWVSADLLRDMDEEAASLLAETPAATVALVHSGFSRDALGDLPGGFGFLAPRGQGVRSLGTLWPGNVFDGREPAGRRLMTTMIGGTHDARAVDLDDAKLTEIVQQDLHTVLGIVTRPYFVKVHRHRRGIPQYTRGHLDRIARVEARLRERVGFYLGGNSYHGVSLNDTIEESSKIAETVLGELARGAASAAM